MAFEFEMNMNLVQSKLGTTVLGCDVWITASQDELNKKHEAKKTGIENLFLLNFV